MRNTEVEQAADRVLSRVPDWLWNGEELPIPVEEIADNCYCLLVRDVEDLLSVPGAPELRRDDVLSGLLIPARGEILINAHEARRWPPRRRFTIGHELGHHVIHSDGQQTIFCRSSAVQESETGKRRPRWTREQRRLWRLEDEASRFSAALLMPRHLVEREFERAQGDLKGLCETFDTSREAMRRRVKDVVGVSLPG